MHSICSCKQLQSAFPVLSGTHTDQPGLFGFCVYSAKEVFEEQLN